MFAPLHAVAGPFAVLDRFSSTGLMLSAGVIVVAFLLFLWQTIEERRRYPVLTTAAAAHERAQTTRRRGVSLLMLINGILIAIGTTIPHKLDGRPNLAFVALWAAVFGLVLVLLALAMIDWAATRRYAQHARAVISREGMAILRDELERRAGERRAADPSSDAPDRLEAPDGPEPGQSVDPHGSPGPLWPKPSDN